MVHFQVLIASHNRRSSTIRAIESITRSAQLARASLAITLADAESSDGTTELVSALFPAVKVLKVGRENYWASSMRLAYLESRFSARDYLVWLNDDVVVHEGALNTILDVLRKHENKCVVSGAMFNPLTGFASYGGYRCSSPSRRLKLDLVQPSREEVPIDFANGNLLVIPHQIELLVDGFPPGFTHAMADLYFSEQLRKRGIPIFLGPGWAGDCVDHSPHGTWLEPSISISGRLSRIFSKKGLPPVDWLKLNLYVEGPRGVLHFLRPYFSALRRRHS